MFLRLVPILKYKISGDSMEPTYQSGDIVLANKLSYFFFSPHIDDIVIVKKPGEKKLIVKRIQKIKNNTYFVVGDNLKESTDSRQFGYIQKKDIVGKVITIVNRK